MLGTPPSPLIRPCDLIAARAARRERAVANRGGRLKRTTPCTGSGREDETGGAMLGGSTGAMLGGGGGDGTRAALPMPEGSLTEPLSPRTLPGPSGMPLTPASCAGAAAGAARIPATASAASHRREKTGCLCFMAADPLDCLSARA
jgi:hypothetical protein